jgi:hypothetical protein
MLKWVTTVVLNRLIVLVAVVLAVNAYTRSRCYQGDDPFSQIGKAISGINDLAGKLNKR